MSAPVAFDNIRGGVWLMADLSLNIWALSLVKWLGADYSASQMVFFRASVGLVVIAPLIWHQRSVFRDVPLIWLHLLRIALSVITLTASFFAIPRLPFAAFTAISFTRPLVTMLLVALILREVIGAQRWIAAGIALVGIAIALNPDDVPWNAGLAAMAVVVLSASAVVVATRRLREAPVIVMMAFYTGGLTVFSALPAALSWAPVAPGHLLPLLLIGCFAQAAQFCFLRAHFHGAAGFLSVLSYLSLVLSIGAGYLFFGEIPGPTFAIGAVIVVAAAIWVTVLSKERPFSGH